MSSIEKAIQKLQKKKKDSGGQLSGTLNSRSSSDANRSIPDAFVDEEEFLATRIQSTQSQQTRRQVTIDLQRLEQRGMLTPDRMHSVMAEEFRGIKRPLISNAFATGALAIDKGNLLMVTSALPGEGKTFISVNLAMSIAMEKDKTVLLVDTDSSKTGVSSLLGISPEPGLTDYLLDDSINLSDLLVRTNIPKLTLLPSGRYNDRVSELMASQNMKRLISDLSQRYPDRVVVFDSPPILATSEARVLTDLVGQVVFVVAAEDTAESAVKDAMEYLDKTRPIGLVFNKKIQSLGTGYNYYGYGAEK